MATTNRLWDCHAQHLQRIEQMREKVEQERYERGGYLDIEDAECKFAPETIPNPFSEEEAKPPRKLDQIIEDAYAYLHRKNEKHAMQVAKADAEAIKMFKANAASEKMLEGKEREPVFERLHKRAEKVQRQSDEAIENENNGNKDPEIKMHRGAPI